MVVVTQVLVEFTALIGGVLPVIIELRIFSVEEMPGMFFSVGLWRLF
ncbi:hypothetical protein [Ruegeria sp. HKCCSP351]|nr:hypothetical protein [Ruegeria sp. HKCCSP351]